MQSTCEHETASAWYIPVWKAHSSSVIIEHSEKPVQQGLAMIAQLQTSRAVPLSKLWTSIWLPQFGYLFATVVPFLPRRSVLASHENLLLCSKHDMMRPRVTTHDHAQTRTTTKKTRANTHHYARTGTTPRISLD
jgi:hypothetical protein